MSNYFGITDTGKMRDNNEDAFIAEKVLKGQYIMACVIDGVGGYEGGEVAAQIARENILSYFSIPSGDMITMMKEALAVANEKIYEEKLKGNQNESMACVLTMAIADIENNKFYYAHIGDTRLYLFRDKSLIKITKDHSFVGFLEDTGRLSEEEAMNHPKRNEINKALGFDAQMRGAAEYIETGESPFLPGDILLLCSDGLSDMVNNKEITSILLNNKTLQEKGKRLIEAANSAGGKDNITVAFIQNDSRAVKQKATKPVLIKKNLPPVNEEPAQELKKEPLPVAKVASAKGNKGIVTFLLVVCFILLCLVLWPFLKNKTSPSNAVSLVQHNQAEQKLADTLDHMITDTLLLAGVYEQPISLTDTVFIDKDSVIIIGNDRTWFRPDGDFKGPAIVFTPKCNYVVLENVKFENFDVAIISTGRQLHLKNVRFENCGVGVMQGFSFSNSNNINGSITDTSFFTTGALDK